MSAMDDIYNTFGSLTTNGQLLPVFERSVISPSTASAPYFAGRGAPPPTLGSIGNMNAIQAASSGDSSWAASGEGGPANLDVAAEAGNDPLNPQKSPVLWAVAFLIIGVMGLRYVHWRG